MTMLGLLDSLMRDQKNVDLALVHGKKKQINKLGRIFVKTLLQSKEGFLAVMDSPFLHLVNPYEIAYAMRCHKKSSLFLKYYKYLVQCIKEEKAEDRQLKTALDAARDCLSKPLLRKPKILLELKEHEQLHKVILASPLVPLEEKELLFSEYSFNLTWRYSEHHYQFMDICASYVIDTWPRHSWYFKKYPGLMKELLDGMGRPMSSHFDKRVSIVMEAFSVLLPTYKEYLHKYIVEGHVPIPEEPFTKIIEENLVTFAQSPRYIELLCKHPSIKKSHLRDLLMAALEISPRRATEVWRLYEQHKLFSEEEAAILTENIRSYESLK